MAVTAMLNSFPQGSSDPETLVNTFEAMTRNISSAAICEAAERFMAGTVQDQSVRFAPSVAEFVREAQRIHDRDEVRRQPLLPAPRVGRTPLLERLDRLRRQYANRPVLHTDVSNDRFRALSKSRELPAGAIWVAALGTVYGPEPR